MKSLKSKQMLQIIKNCFLLLICFYSSAIFAQGETPVFSNNISSPESKSSASGSSSSVDMYRGTQNTTIPIYNYKGREIDLPISINNVSTGIRVDQIANNVGLGWNLNVGGRITRAASGVPDDYSISGIQANYCNQYEERCQSCHWKDYYKANVMGVEDVFQFTSCPMCIASLSNPKTMVEITQDAAFNGAGDWIITAEDGTKFYFTGVRETISTVRSVCESSSITAWLLTKILSKNKLDEYIFSYQNFQWTTPIPNNGEGYITSSTGSQNHDIVTNSSYKLNQQMISEIYHNGEKIISFNYGPRSDLVNVSNALEEIVFHNYKIGSAFRKAVFTYNYFGPTSATDPLYKRLKLDKLTFYGYNTDYPNGQSGNEYSFNYIDETLVAPITSFARDLLGLQNTKTNNQNLLPYQGHRDFNLTASLAGTLSEVHYPNKGYTKFDYEQNALNGGYGTTTTPAYTETINTSVQADILNRHYFSDFCGYEMEDQYSEPNAAMQFFLWSQYPYYNPQLQSVQSLIHRMRTIAVRIEEQTSAFLETAGDGVYLIQKIENCTAVDDYDSCFSNDNSVFNSCMINSNLIFYTGGQNPVSSQGNSFISRGLTTRIGDPNDNPIPLTLQPGLYQITLWDYEPDPEYSASIRIYKYVPLTYTIDHPAVTTNLDQTTTLVDGFRVKSITNFSDANTFAGKKLYKYSDGQMTELLQSSYNYHVDMNTTIYKNYSQGYANAPEIVHYHSVCEVPVNSQDQDNGYIRYSFMLDTTTGFNHSSGFDYDSLNFPFNHIYDSGHAKVWSYYTPLNNSLLTKKIIYNKSGQIINEQNIVHGYENFNIGLYWDIEHIISYMDESQFQFITSNTNSDYLIPDDPTSKIEKQEFWSYSGTMLIEHGNPNEYMTFQYNEFDNELFKVTGVNTATHGFTKYIYAQFGLRNLIKEKQHFDDDGGLLLDKTFFDYDTAGNMIEAIQYTPGNLTSYNYESYIYGYNNRFPIAKLSGVKHIDIPPAIITTAVNQSNDPLNYTEEQLRITLETLRSSFPDALITTFTYNPSYRISSTTDPKGYTLFYKYDVFGRLQYTKEKEISISTNLPTGNLEILSENQYNTRHQ